MKNHLHKMNRGILALLVVTSMFYSCSEDLILEHETLPKEFKPNVDSRINYNKINVKNKGYRGLNGSVDLLVFKSKEDFLYTLNELERQRRTLDSLFVSFYKDLSIEELNKIEEEIGFDQFLPFDIFQNKIGYHSLFKEISQIEKVWLNNEELDFENHPDDHFIDEKEYRVLFNTDSEVQIGEKIYKLVEDGYFEIENSDLSALRILNDMDFGQKIILPKNIAFYTYGGEKSSEYNKSMNSQCRSGITQSGFKKSILGDWRLRWRLAHRTPLFGQRHVYAETTTYEKRTFFNGWKKVRGYTYAQVYGDIVNNSSCTSDKLTFNTLGSQYFQQSTRVNSIKHRINVSSLTQSGWVQGHFIGPGFFDIDTKAKLTW